MEKGLEVAQGKSNSQEHSDNLELVFSSASYGSIWTSSL